MAEKPSLGRGARAVVREIDQELERVNRGLSRYEPLLRERERLLAARAALTGERRGKAAARTSQDDVAAFLAEHPGSWPAEIAAALGVPVTNVSAHLYRGKSTRFARDKRGWCLRLGGGSDGR
jgi:DNA-directed RNA polymerase specialized sigma24 family protein